MHHLKEGGSRKGKGLRPGVVHRLDRETSGVLVIAKDAKSLALFQRIEHAALRVMMTDELPAIGDVEVIKSGERFPQGDVNTREIILSRKGQGERVKTLIVTGTSFRMSA